MRLSPLTILGLLLAAVFALSACGGDDEEDSGGGAPPVARTEDFPKAAGQSIAELRESLGPGPVIAPSVSLLEPGKNRFGFGLFDRARKQISEAAVALYVAPAGGTAPVEGPFLAKFEALDVNPRFRSESVSSDPDAAESLYVAELEFPEAADFDILAAVRLDDRIVAADPIRLRVVKDGEVPEAGEKPPTINTPTLKDVGGKVDEIDTRVPPAPDLHEDDYADVAGKRPVTILFATPALCVSRVCGPVVDIMKQVKADHEDTDMAWIHMEIYNDNEVDKGFREQVLRWRLPTEPWVFTIDRSGKVAASLEGAFSAEELDRAVRAALKG